MNLFKAFNFQKSSTNFQKSSLEQIDTERKADQNSFVDLSKLFGGKTTAKREKSKWNTTFGGNTPL